MGPIDQHAQLGLETGLEQNYCPRWSDGYREPLQPLFGEEEARRRWAKGEYFTKLLPEAARPQLAIETGEMHRGGRSIAYMVFDPELRVVREYVWQEDHEPGEMILRGAQFRSFDRPSAMPSPSGAFHATPDSYLGFNFHFDLRWGSREWTEGPDNRFCREDFTIRDASQLRCPTPGFDDLLGPLNRAEGIDYDELIQPKARG